MKYRLLDRPGSWAGKRLLQVRMRNLASYIATFTFLAYNGTPGANLKVSTLRRFNNVLKKSLQIPLYGDGGAIVV